MKKHSENISRQRTLDVPSRLNISADASDGVLRRFADHQALVAGSIAQISETKQRQEESLAAANRSFELVSKVFQAHVEGRKVA